MFQKIMSVLILIQFNIHNIIYSSSVGGKHVKSDQTKEEYLQISIKGENPKMLVFGGNTDSNVFSEVWSPLKPSVNCFIPIPPDWDYGKSVKIVNDSSSFILACIRYKKKCWLFEDHAQGWIEGPELPKFLGVASMTSHGDTAYLIQDTAIHVMTNMEWKTSNVSLNTKRMYHCAVILKNSLYVLGGMDLKTVEEFNIKGSLSESSSPPPPDMMKSRRNHGCAVFENEGKNKIITAGGYDEDSVEIWWPGEKAWKIIGSLPESRKDFSLTLLPNMLVIAGGETTSVESSVTVLISQNGSSWMPGPELENSRRQNSGVILKTQDKFCPKGVIPTTTLPTTTSTTSTSTTTTTTSSQPPTTITTSPPITTITTSSPPTTITRSTTSIATQPTTMTITTSSPPTTTITRPTTTSLLPTTATSTITTATSLPTITSEKTTTITQTTSTTTTRSLTTTTSTTTAITTTTTSSPPPTTTATSTQPTTTIIPPKITSVKPTSTTASIITTTSPITSKCSKNDSRNVHWEVETGDTGIKNCTEGTAGDTGEVTWRCGDAGEFLTKQPDRTECKWSWIDDINDALDNGNISSLDISTMVMSNMTKLDLCETAMGGGTLLKLIDELLPNLMMLRHAESHLDLEEIFTSTQLNFTSNLFNILDASINDTRSWLDLPLDRIHYNLSTSLLVSSEDAGFLFLKNNTQQFNYTSHHINVFLRVIQSFDESCLIFDEVSYCLPNLNLLNETTFQVYSSVFRFMSEDVEYLPTSYLRYNWYHNTSSNQSSKKYLKNIFGLTLNNKSQYLSPEFDNFHSDNEIVSILFNHKKVEHHERTVCVSLDVDTSEWTTKGCWLKNSSATQSICSCNHLTNFGILVDVWNVKEDKILDEINIILGIISCICLLATLFLLWRKRSGDPLDEMETNRTCCLLVFMLSFLVLVPQEYNLSSNHQILQFTCQVFGAICHFSWLAMFIWTGFESYYFYKLFVVVLKGSSMKRVPQYCVAYGVPSLLVYLTFQAEAITCNFNVLNESDCQLYRKPTYYEWHTTGDEAVMIKGWCWMNMFSIWGSIIPAGVILFCNMLMTARVVYIGYQAGLRWSKPKRQRIMKGFRNTIMISILLGLTWLTGLLVYTEVPAMLYIFVIFNSACGIWHLLYQTVLKLEDTVKNKESDSNTTSVSHVE